MASKSSYTRVKAHLLKIPGEGISICPEISNKRKAELQKLEEEAENIRLQKVPKRVPLPPPNPPFSNLFNLVSDENSKKRNLGTGSRSGVGSVSNSRKSNSIEKAFDNQTRDVAHSLIARMFYSGGLPFHLARNPYYVAAMSFLANNNLPGYLPPGYNLLRGPLLQKEKTNIERLLEPIKGTWRDKGVTIVSDGWSDSQRRPLINFIAMTSDGPMFLKAVDCSGEVKDKFFISNLMREVIKEVGAENVVQIVTDNAANCKAAGQLIEGEFPHISWTPCVVHTLNLALKNICAAKNVENNQTTYNECSWITEIASEVMQVKNFIMNHSMRLAIFNEFSSLKLLSVADTRFASVIVMLRRFKLIKNSLQAMVISDRWSCYRDDDVQKARKVKDKLLDDIWWDKINYIISFTEPIYSMIRACDTDKPCLHLVYDMWDSMIYKVKSAIFKYEKLREDEQSSFYDVVNRILVDRWNKNNTPLHCLAHSINPRYYSDEWLREDPKRVSPHNDDEIAQGRAKILKKYFPSLVERNKANAEYVHFISRTGPFSEYDSIINRYEMDPYSWWVIYGTGAPLPRSIAIKLLGQPASSSCAERNWSIYGFVNSMKRNKMTPTRAEDLVYIHSNLRLLPGIRERRDKDVGHNGGCL